MKTQARLAAIAIVLAAACATLVTPTLAAEYTLKWATVTRGDMQEKFGHKLAEVLPKATNGRVEVKVFPGGQLGSPAAMIETIYSPSPHARPMAATHHNPAAVVSPRTPLKCLMIAPAPRNPIPVITP